MRVGRMVVLLIVLAVASAGCSSSDGKAMDACREKAFWDGTDAKDANKYCKAALEHQEDERKAGDSGSPGGDPGGVDDGVGGATDQVIPDLVGSELPDAVRLLEAMGFARPEVADASGGQETPSGSGWVVLKVSPAAGEQVPTSEQVTLLVARAS